MYIKTCPDKEGNLFKKKTLVVTEGLASQNIGILFVDDRVGITIRVSGNVSIK